VGVTFQRCSFMLCLRQLVVGLSLWRPVFIPRPVQVLWQTKWYWDTFFAKYRHTLQNVSLVTFYW